MSDFYDDIANSRTDEQEAKDRKSFYDSFVNYGNSKSEVQQNSKSLPTAQAEVKEPERFVNPLLETWRLSTTQEKNDDYPHVWGCTPFVETFLLAWTLVGLAVFVRLCLFVKIKTDKI